MVVMLSITILAITGPQATFRNIHGTSNSSPLVELMKLEDKMTNPCQRHSSVECVCQRHPGFRFRGGPKSEIGIQTSRRGNRIGGRIMYQVIWQEGNKIEFALEGELTANDFQQVIHQLESLCTMNPHIFTSSLM